MGRNSEREFLLVAKNEEVLKLAQQLFSPGEWVDGQGLLDWGSYENTATRVSIAGELSKRMPIDTHQRVGLVVPVDEGETDTEWTTRVWSHPIISIMWTGFKHHRAIPDNKVPRQ